MKKLIFILFLFFILSSIIFSQEGTYRVGKTSCTIESSHSYFKVYWENGIGYTQLTYDETYPNGNIVYKEYDYHSENNIEYVGSFIFKDERYLSGIYERADGKTFKLKKISR